MIDDAPRHKRNASRHKRNALHHERNAPRHILYFSILNVLEAKLEQLSEVAPVIIQ